MSMYHQTKSTRGASRVSVTMSILALALVFAIGQTAYAGVTGSKHDFSGDVWNAAGEMCNTCHTPHNSDVTVSGAPLWNHEVTAATFTVYTSPTLDSVAGQPAGATKLCLSCHDGTVAVDSFGGRSGTDFLTGNKKVGPDLSNDHPVSMTYDAVADTSLVATSATSGLGGTIDGDLLFAGKVECASCHDVHDEAGNANLLVKPNTASALCLTCHAK